MTRPTPTPASLLDQLWATREADAAARFAALLAGGAR